MLPRERIRSQCALVLWWLVAIAGCDRVPDAALTPSDFDYSVAQPATQCAAGSKPGAGSDTVETTTPNGIRYVLRAPANYRPDVAHPLLVVFAPAGHGPLANERFTRFTHEATARGWLVAYAGARPMSLGTVQAFASLPQAITARWCVDESRIYATGHSDGGTVSTALALLPGIPHPFAAIAPSAAGFSGEDLTGYACPAPTPVMVLHNHDDALFPGFGTATATWWAQCNGCVARPASTGDACVSFDGCPAAAPVSLCLQAGDHRQWPARQSAILDFLAAQHRP